MVGPSGQKRRRLSWSDERLPKTAKVSAEVEDTNPYIFERLGSHKKSSGDRRTSILNHSALMAASTPNCSAQRIVLGSGKNLEEGLMINSNPSKSI